MNDDKVFIVRNRQKVIGVDTRALRRMVLSVINDDLHLGAFEVGCYLVGHRESERLNLAYLKHDGPTDVITFDHSDETHGGTDRAIGRQRRSRSPSPIHGEIFICVDVALSQARAYRTTWQSEVLRYVVHGLLHLLGYDDCEPSSRRRMKRVENKLVSKVQQRFPVGQLLAKRKRPTGSSMR
jgi:probable rRNA maturation factor